MTEHGLPKSAADTQALRRTASEHASGSALRWMLTRKPAKWPRWIESQPGPAPPQRVGRGELAWVVINHATVLIQVGGLNLLTDPMWSMRASPVSWAGPRRVRAPGLRFEDLPPIDAVLLSHNHYDHCDLPTLRRLWKEHHMPVIAGRGHRALLRRCGCRRVSELRWWETSGLSSAGGEVAVRYVPSQHFSGRGLRDRNRAAWGGFVIESPTGVVYFAADSGYRREMFSEIHRRCCAPRLSFLPIGAYEPRWFMGPVHMDPAEAVQAHLDLASERSVGIHFGTFQLTDEGIDEPVLGLERAREAAGVGAGEFLVPEFGARVEER